MKNWSRGWKYSERCYSIILEGDKPISLFDKAINKTLGMAYSTNNEKNYFRTLRDFKKIHGKVLERIKSSLEAGDRDSARRLAHSLKSSSALIGAETLSGIAIKAEKALENSGSQAEADKIMAELEEAFTELMAELDCLPETEAPKMAFDKDRALALTEKILPLLDKSDAMVLSFRDEVEEVFLPFGKEGEELLGLIDSFDLSEAAKVLIKIKSML